MYAASFEAGFDFRLEQLRLGTSAVQVEYKQTFKLRSTEDAFAALEDNTVTLSTMKASKFFLVFEKEITHWEQTLSLVSEMIEMVQQVQRSWQYLENIFVGSEDIRKQLPQESVMFDIVHQTFMERMAQLAELKNIVKACTLPGMLEGFNDMDAKLEKIQKSLENYLEAKRQQFPRFYFLSSDDLLEILGQAKDPQNVQSHLKKCFEGIKRLEMFPPGTDGRRQWESTSVYSPDGCALCFSSLQGSRLWANFGQCITSCPSSCSLTPSFPSCISSCLQGEPGLQQPCRDRGAARRVAQRCRGRHVCCLQNHHVRRPGSIQDDEEREVGER